MFDPSTYEMVTFMVKRVPQVGIENFVDAIGWCRFDDKADRSLVQSRCAITDLRNDILTQ